jgi:predicted RNA binding protein YcfA (HicA-like mRNA interferase family)
VHSPRGSNKAKLLAKLRAGQSDRIFTFAKPELLLLQAGFVHEGGQGSHRIYRHPDGRKMVLAPHGNAVKPVYIREIRNCSHHEEEKIHASVSRPALLE